MSAAWLDTLIDVAGDNPSLALGGCVIGACFGFFSQRSRFCLRSATLETAHQQPGEKLAVWLIVFGMALLCTQLLIVFDWFDTGAVRQLNNRGSLSGAIIGGLVFGCGMVLCRACGSRMLVLSASGNMRSMLSVVMFAFVAQMSLNGLLMPIRSAINDWWTIESTARDLLINFSMTHAHACVFSAGWIALGTWLAWQSHISLKQSLFASIVGASIALAWWFNYTMASRIFEMAQVHALTFASPTADVLMYVLEPQGRSLSFDIGLIPGVLMGSFFAAWLSREFKLEGFAQIASVGRYLTGGALMGFGAILAGGCAVGAGVSGASVFSLTAWIVLWSMWLGAVLTDRVVDGR